MQANSPRTVDYDKPFFDDFTDTSLQSAQIVLRALFEHYRPASIVDVGCGVGPWIKAATELGVTSARGFDGPWVQDTQLLFPRETFTRVDFEGAEWPDFGKADLAISLEVAEHLTLPQGEALVGKLCACAPVVLFSAAVPAQGGHGHLNEQWQSWWAQRFAKLSYQPSLCIRDRIWNDGNVSFWYRQNAVLYFDPVRVPQLAPLAASSGLLDVVHPDLYQIRVLKRLRHGRLRRAFDGLRLR